jgi:hypothetical protein
MRVAKNRIMIYGPKEHRERLANKLAKLLERKTSGLTRTHFAFRIDMWDASSENLVEHIAGVEDYQVAQATYRTAVERRPGAAITLRLSRHVVAKL